MKMKELRGLSKDELQAKLTETRQELFNLRLQHATAQLEKTASIPAAKMNSAIEQRKGRTLVGTVISDKCDKTIVVRVETLVQHPLLKKYVRRRKKCTAHDPNNECGIGDKVKIVEFRPMSRNKRWHLVSILEKAV